MEKKLFFLKKDKTFPRSEERHESNVINEARFMVDTIIMEFQNTKYKEIIKRFRGGRGINRLPTRE